MSLFNRTKTDTNSDGETKSASESLLEELRELSALSKKLDAANTDDMHDFKKINNTKSVIKKKLMALIPTFVVAEKEYIQFRKETAEQVAAIILKIRELNEERSKIGYIQHPFNKCRDLSRILEQAAGLEKGTINHQIEEIKGSAKTQNPYFG